MPYLKLAFSLFFIMLFSPIAVAQAPVNMQDSGNPEWIAQCGQQGGYRACENLADQHFKGLGVPKNIRMTAYYLLKACRYGSMDMCGFAAKMADEEANDIAIYGEAVARLCQFGDAANCTLPYFKYRDPSTPQYNPSFVGGALEMGCEKGSGYACYLMGNWYDDYKPAPTVVSDPNKASIGFQRTCISEPTDRNLDRAKIKFGCHGAYKYLIGKDGAEKNLEQAKQALLRTCEMADDVETCEYIATVFYHGGKGMEKDPSASAAMAERACDLGGSNIFCALAGYYYAEQNEQAKAFPLYAKACDQKLVVNDCIAATTTAYFALGEKNQATTDYALKACNQGDGWSCYLYATNTFFLSSEGNKDWFKKACDNGSEQGCDEVKRRAEYEENRNDPSYNCPRASCETRTWAEFLRDEHAAAAQNQAQNQTGTPGWVIQVPTRMPTTPFGSTERDITNWNKYTENQRCSNPTAFGC